MAHAMPACLRLSFTANPLSTFPRDENDGKRFKLQWLFQLLHCRKITLESNQSFAWKA
jgi:hypothetical protein